MLSLILIRHGETTWNNERRIQGQTDIPLNDTGLAQASELSALCAQWLPSKIPAAIFSSPLLRALQTAQIALGEKSTIVVDDRLSEINYGDWSGWQIDALRQQHPRQTDRWFSRLEREYCPHGGESWEALRRRVMDFHQGSVQTRLDDSSQQVMLFTHGAFINEYLNHLLGSHAIFNTLNASLTEVRLELRQPPRLVVYNLTASRLFPQSEGHSDGA